MADAWSWTTDTAPPVTVFEWSAKGRVLYLRWYEPGPLIPDGKRGRGNYRYRSLGQTVRTPTGHLRAETVSWAKREAERHALSLQAGAVAPVAVIAPKTTGTLTVGEAARLVTDPVKGKYPLAAGQKGSNHVREVVRAMAFAEHHWGANTAWARLDEESLRDLWRARLHELAAKDRVGYRGTETFVCRILAVAAWLRRTRRIPADCLLPPSRWRQELLSDWRSATGARHDPEPERPRYTLDEVRRFFAALERGEPRLALAMALGAEYRLGQVLRQRRKHLDLVAGTFRVSTTGKKGGELVHLTSEQRRAAERAVGVGYLALLEKAGGDYPLFPSGRLEGWTAEGGAVVDGRRKGHRMMAGALHASEAHRDRQPWAPSAAREAFRAVEAAAEITHVEGRGWYAIRRAAVDFNKRRKATAEAVMAGGGWSDPRMPDTIYADPEKDYARDEARDHRAAFRAEVASG